jgi:serine/threonine-protein kinase
LLQGHTQRIDTTLPEGGAPAASPKKIGKYEIIEPIGEGGFGMVYKGFDPFIKRHVAIKTCTSPDQELRQRYFREAEIAGRLDHPNIVRIFDFGTENDTPFLVQEFLAGGDLDRKIGGHEFVPFPERLLYLIHIARGLAYAHDQGVIHRDIKPANIRILEDGSAKIMDFGVAMLQNTDTRLTKDGMAVGTAAYLAPEQVKGVTPDNRSDIFSYGVMAYELLTGERPFQQDTISATLFSILHDDPKPIALPSHLCPDSLRRLVERCMDKEPDQRPANVAEILEELDNVRTEMHAADQDRDFTGELRNVSSDANPRQSSRGFDPPIQHQWTPPSVRMQRRRRWIAVAVPAALMAVLATAYGLLASQGVLSWPEKPVPESVQNGPPAAEEPAAMSATPLAAIVAEPDSTLDSPATVETESIDLGSQLEPEPEPEAPPPPPVIEKATLYLGQGWHNSITAAIDSGQPIALTRTRSRQLEPGDHVVRYSLNTGEYESSQTVRVQLQAGEEKTLKNPIGRPGHLSVQASLGSPQGLVRVNGKPLGSSPVRGHLISPGRHQLQVFSVNDPDLALAEVTAEIRSGRETVITFDLTGQRDLAVRYREPST